MTGLVFALGAAGVTGFDPASVLEPAVWIVVVALFSWIVFEVLRTAARRVDDAGFDVV